MSKNSGPGLLNLVNQHLLQASWCPKLYHSRGKKESSFFFRGTERTCLNLRLQSRRYIDGSIFSLITLGTPQVQQRKHCRKWICNIILILNASFAFRVRVKTWLRSSMGDGRLSGLALMHVHRKIPLDPMRVLQRWDASSH